MHDGYILIFVLWKHALLLEWLLYVFIDKEISFLRRKFVCILTDMSTCLCTDKFMTYLFISKFVDMSLNRQLYWHVLSTKLSTCLFIAKIILIFVLTNLLARVHTDKFVDMLLPTGTLPVLGWRKKWKLPILWSWFKKRRRWWQ